MFVCDLHLQLHGSSAQVHFIPDVLSVLVEVSMGSNITTRITSYH